MSSWIRTTRANKCPVCGKDSWCTFNDEVVLCMRVQSEREKVFKDGSVGWIHRVGGTNTVHSRAVNLAHRMEEPSINPRKLMEEFLEDTLASQIAALSINLGVSSSSLRHLGCAWAAPYRAYAFPMWDQHGSMTGIRLRSVNGKKWAVRGSKQGVFRVFGVKARRGYVCEGPTDTAAILTMGGYAIGRPHCSGGLAEVGPIMREAGVSEVVILADNDDPGMRGARMLQNHLRMRSVILLLPCKDIRKFLNEGGTIADLDGLTESLVWRQSQHSS